MCIVIGFKTGCDVMNFEVNLSNQVVFPTRPKSRDKTLYILRRSRALK